jgi:hypothetical protein
VILPTFRFAGRPPTPADGRNPKQLVSGCGEGEAVIFSTQKLIRLAIGPKDFSAFESCTTPPRFRLASGLPPTNASRMEKPDQFRELFRMQKALNERIGVQTEGMSEEEKTKWILNYCRAMTQEIAELTDSVPWKWWAKYQKFDAQNARVEVLICSIFSSAWRRCWA